MLMRVWSNKNSHSLLVGMQNGTATMKDSLAVYYKTNDPAVTLLSTNPKELKIYAHTKTCTWMFIADLLLIVKTWKQPRCHSAGDWINKLW